MSVVIVTGSAGLVGSESVRHFASLGYDVAGIDNNMRLRFFGPTASTEPMRCTLQREVRRYRHHNIDIRDAAAIERLFAGLGADIALVIHCAAQPSHDWAASDPSEDLTINTNGTSVLLEATRKHAAHAPFIYMSTNKVYGDTPNRLPLIELESRWEIAPGHEYENGISESMSVDQNLHSLFGVSKLAADMLVQEYGRYFGMKTACFRGGCLTGPNHAGAELHGFLSYLMKCVCAGTPYHVFGYGAKQVRDNIHSLDLVRAFEHFMRAPRSGEVYNIGGGRHSNCSVREAISISEEIAGRKLDWDYVDRNRIGDHVWWISDCSRFQRHYPGWQHTYSVGQILREIYDAERARTLVPAPVKAAVAPVKLPARKNVLGVMVHAADYDSAVAAIEQAAKGRERLTVSALAVHGVMTGALDKQQRYRLNSLDMVVPDGQPVRWALKWLHGAALKDRVYGPSLTLRVCAMAERESLPVLFYGSEPRVLQQLDKHLRERFPKLEIAGAIPSRFRCVTPEEKDSVVRAIREHDPAIVFVGLGCPRQEVFAYEFGNALSCPVLAVGAAFPFLAGELPQAPAWMQRSGLEWAFRLTREPRRLWRRYLLLNPMYLSMIAAQLTHVHDFDTSGTRPASEVLYA